MSTMNGTNTTTTTIAVGLGPVEQWIQLMLFYVAGGSVSSIGYFLVAIGITRSKKLRTRFFIVLWSLVVCRAFVSAQYFVMGLYRSLRTVQLAPTQMPAAACNGIHFWMLVGLTLEISLLLIIVLDRALAIMTPNFYRSLTSKQAVMICAITYVVVFILKIPFAFASMRSQVVSCVNSYSAPGDRFNDYTQNIDLAILCLTLLVYVVLLLFVRFKISALRAKGKFNDQSPDSVSLKRQLELMPTLQQLILLHCGLTLISRILRTGAGMTTDPYLSARLSAYGGSMSVVDLFTNLVALLWCNAKVRRATFWCCGKNRVESVVRTVTESKWAQVGRGVSAMGTRNTAFTKA